MHRRKSSLVTRNDKRPSTPCAEQTLWISGRHASLAALANPDRLCRRVLVTPAGAAEVSGVMAGLRAEGRVLPEPEVVARAVIDAVAPEAVHQGVAVQVTPLAPLSLEAVLDRALTRAVIVVLDQITDPHNVGAILRSAAAFGALAVVMQDRHVPPETAALAKAASGGLESVPMARVVNLTRAIGSLKTAGFWAIGLDAAAPLSLARVDRADRIALVLGSEGQGLRRLVRAECDSLASLPMTGAVESLNVSNAAAVALYELVRTPPDSPHHLAGTGTPLI
ncbi:MAG: 23S rRNA (guanosine2251-2'-O)-methyltransferase [Rhodospirillaceae bacterium]|nr:MAG: 23S rRNA (guanosine2251-2'-O)-methyltransferase [Rhodospirillaceae bacterium]